MSNYGFTNEAGEPIMDAAAYRYEQYIDSMYEPDPDEFYAADDDEAPCESDPSACTRADADYVDENTAECPWCRQQWKYDWS